MDPRKPTTLRRSKGRRNLGASVILFRLQPEEDPTRYQHRELGQDHRARMEDDTTQWVTSSQGGSSSFQADPQSCDLRNTAHHHYQSHATLRFHILVLLLVVVFLEFNTAWMEEIITSFDVPVTDTNGTVYTSYTSLHSVLDCNDCMCACHPY